MKINNVHYRTIWEKSEGIIQIIDQRKLPFRFEIKDLTELEDFETAIKHMYVRGAPLIGVTAAYGMYIAAANASDSDICDTLSRAAERLIATRPTAVNLRWAVESQLSIIKNTSNLDPIKEKLLINARRITENDEEQCRMIGVHGLKLIEEIAKKKNGATVNILTHCNAGWLATVDWGTATSPIYHARNAGIDIHVWVDETRPRNQGAKLTAYELAHEDIPHTVIVDNVGGHLMQHGKVDIVIVGSDRTTYTGDVANKIGTYLKALAAIDNNIPFYVALPSSTIDWEIEDGVNSIPIEERDSDEVDFMEGVAGSKVEKVRIVPETSRSANYAFDVTPARLVTGLITERGVCKADKESVLELFPEKK
jgi:methylthioribose-1-phosphate isomerase